MQSFQFDDFTITLDKEGASEYAKVSYPIRYGRFAEIKTPEHIFQANLNGEIRYIQGRTPSWPHPAEWLKRTVGNDWVYYSAGDYKGVYDLMGEYYFPCLSYTSNSIFDDAPFENKAVKSAIRSWHKFQAQLKTLPIVEIPPSLRDYLVRLTDSDTRTLYLRSQKLHRLLGGQVTVLPPDTRHVDYDVIPVIIADGCLYHCGFCRVKSGRNFAPRTRGNILEQIKKLKTFYGLETPNHNSLFLGENDALRAGRGLIEFATKTAYEIFRFENSYLRTPRLFLFGSVDSMLRSEETLFEMLNALPFFTYINVGLESADPATLGTLRKPITHSMVLEAFDRLLDINRRYEKIEVTANFVLGGDLPGDHLTSLVTLTRKRRDPLSRKGANYLSPIMGGKTRDIRSRRAMLKKLHEVKTHSQLPTFLYLIQRL